MSVWSRRALRSPARRGGAAAALVACLTLVAAVAASATTAASKVTLVVQSGAGGNDLKAAAYLAKAFEAKYPNIKVNIQTVSEQMGAATNAQIATSKNPPDVMRINTNVNYYPLLVAKHKLVDLTGVYQATDFAKRAGAAVSASMKAPDGKYYSIAPSKIYYNLVYYNADLFKQAGITIPANHRIASVRQFYAMVAALKKIGKGGLAIGGKSGYEAGWMIDALLPTNTTTAQMQNYLTNWQKSVRVTAKYTDPAFMKVLNELQAFAYNGVYQAGYLGVDEAGSQAPYDSGQTGMLLGGVWDAAGQRSLAKFPYQWLLLPPIGRHQTQLSSALGGFYSIPTGSKHQAEAKKFLEFALSNKMQEQDIVDISGLLPSVQLPVSALSKLDPLAKEMLADDAKNGSVPGWSNNIPGNMSYVLIDTELQAMYSGQTTPAEIAAKEQAALVTARG